MLHPRSGPGQPLCLSVAVSQARLWQRLNIAGGAAQALLWRASGSNHALQLMNSSDAGNEAIAVCMSHTYDNAALQHVYSSNGGVALHLCATQALSELIWCLHALQYIKSRDAVKPRVMQEQEKLKGSAQYLGQLFREMQVGHAGCFGRRFNIHARSGQRTQECSRRSLLDSEAAACLATYLVAVLRGAALQGGACATDATPASAIIFSSHGHQSLDNKGPP